MAGDNGSRRFIKVWWAFAFTLGAITGAVAVTFAGIADTMWAIAGLGVPITATFALLEWLTVRRAAPGRPVPHGWRQAMRVNSGQSPQKSAKGKLAPRRGQLRAIAGRKSGEPPSSGAS